MTTPTTTPFYQKWLMSYMAGAIAILKPAIPFVAICVFAILFDCLTAFFLSRRVKASTGKSSGKFRSRKAEKVPETMINAFAFIVLAIMVNEYITVAYGNLYLPNVAAAIIVGVQLVSVLENMSSCNDSLWARLLQLVFIDKSSRHHDVENPDNMKKTIYEKISEAWHRLLAETPKKWKRIQAISLSAGVSCFAVVSANGLMDLQLPVVVITLLKYSIGVCVFITGRSQFKTKDNE